MKIYTSNGKRIKQVKDFYETTGSEHVARTSRGFVVFASNSYAMSCTVVCYLNIR